MTIDILEDLTLIGGTDKILTFTVYDETSNLLDLNGGSVTWLLCPYGSFSVNILTIAGVLDPTPPVNSFTVTIPAVDTLTLNGKYIQQVVVTDSNGDTFVPAQGNILIYPAISV